MIESFAPTQTTEARLPLHAGVTGPTFSIVVPVHNELAGLPELYRRVKVVMDRTGEPWELVLVDDGSQDDSAGGIAQLCSQDARVRGLSLTRNFGFQVAVTAGLDAARGNAVVVMDADLQDPPEVIPQLIEKWWAGYEVVYGVRGERAGETWFKRATASAFYRLMRRLTNVDLPVDTGDFRLMDRRVVEAIRHMPEQHRFLRGMVSWVGFKQTGVMYKRQPRYTGRTSFTVARMVRFALDGLTSFSNFPLHAASYLGLALTGLSGLVLLAGVVSWLSGWAWLGGSAAVVVTMLLLGGVQLICLGVLGEYLGRMYDEIKGRPLYLVERRWGFGSSRN